jgi:predicted DNA-binding protein with PD1-like motif
MKEAILDPGQVIVIHLDKGEDILSSLKNYTKTTGLQDAVFLTAIGTLQRVRVHMVLDDGFPPVEYFREEVGEFEILSLQGYIANGDIHAHLTVSDEHSAFGGHLEENTIVLHMSDIVLQALGGGIQLTRKKDPTKNNVLMLSFEPKQEVK